MFGQQTPNTLVEIQPFLVRYRDFSLLGGVTLIKVPSSAPKQPYKLVIRHHEKYYQ